jgi:hypothetical protein
VARKLLSDQLHVKIFASLSDSTISQIRFPSSRSVKILFLSTNGRIGGAERVLLDMISSCRVAHPEWQLALIVAAPGELCEEAKRLGAAVELLPLPLGLAQLGRRLCWKPLHARQRRIECFGSSRQRICSDYQVHQTISAKYPSHRTHSGTQQRFQDASASGLGVSTSDTTRLAFS